MKKVSKVKNENVVKQRNKYTTEHKEKARKYYLMGLNMQEISILLNGCPVRTLEKWQSSNKWTDLKQLENIKLRAFELHEAGKSYPEIAEILKIGYTTVWRYIRIAKNATDTKKQP